jgi:hypothetical protein
MRKLAIGLAAVWLGLGSGRVFATEMHERGQPTKLGDTPSAVQTTFGQESKGGTIEDLRKEKLKDGETVYRGEVVKNGKGREIEVSESGKVISRSKAHNESKEKGEHGQK